MSFLPPDFGGLVGAWDPRRPGSPRAMIVSIGQKDGKRVEQGMVLTPLNLLQLRKTVNSLIAQGEMEGHITDEHHWQSERLPPVMTTAEEAEKDIMPRSKVDEIAGPD